ncbi:MAG: hypothetical protein ACTSRI_11370, partial [Promethearchaeota archaeon]
VPEKPENIIELIDELLTEPNTKNAEAFYNTIKKFKRWETRELSPIRFMLDTELAWLDGKMYVGDI